MKLIKTGIIILLLAITFCTIAVIATDIKEDESVPAMTQAPVADGITGYSNWDIYWTSSGAMSWYEGDTLSFVYGYPLHTGQYYWFYLKPSVTDVWCIIPFTNTITHSGAHPKTKMLFIQAAGTTSATGVRIDSFDVYNGPNKITTIYPTGWAFGTTPVLYTIDLGSYYEFDRGCQILLRLRNMDSVSNHGFYVYGAGQKAEW